MTTLPPIFLFALQKVLYGAIHAWFESLQCDHQVEPECYPLMIKCMCLSLLLKIIRQKCIRLACNNLTFFYSIYTIFNCNIRKHTVQRDYKFHVTPFLHHFLHRFFQIKFFCSRVTGNTRNSNISNQLHAEIRC